MNVLKYIIFSPFDVIFLIFGIIYYKVKKKTPYIAYKSMLRLFYIYGGIVTRFVGYCTSERIKNISFFREKENEIEEFKIEQIKNNIFENGFYQYDNFLDTKQIDKIKEIVKNYKFKLRPSDEDLKIDNYKPKENFFNPSSPEAVLYEMDPDFLIKQEIIQEIITDKKIYEISKKYFSSEPLFDHVSISITSDYNKMQKPDSKAAQLYHFDLDRPKWLKFLIYINDVNEDNGPHCYIEKTHKPYGIPFIFRSRGYVRIQDQDLNKLNLKKHTFCAKAGTAIIEDTVGLHKGSVVQNGYRILLNIQVNNSMFGSNINKYNLKDIDVSKKKKIIDTKHFFKYTISV